MKIIDWILQAIQIKFTLFCFSISGLLISLTSNAQSIGDWERFLSLKNPRISGGDVVYHYDRESLKFVSLREFFIETNEFMSLFVPRNDFTESSKFLRVNVRTSYPSPIRIDDFIVSSRLSRIGIDCEKDGLVILHRTYYSGTLLMGKHYNNHPNDYPADRIIISDIKENDVGLKYISVIYNKIKSLCNR